jgi:hypothetical protein
MPISLVAFLVAAVTRFIIGEVDTVDFQAQCVYNWLLPIKQTYVWYTSSTAALLEI